MRKFLSLLLSTLILVSTGIICFSVGAEVLETPANPKPDMLYVHTVADAQDTEAWHHWQHADSYRDYDEEDHEELGLVAGEGVSEEMYFFLPSGTDAEQVVIYNSYSSPVTIGDTTIQPDTTATVSYDTETTYTVTVPVTIEDTTTTPAITEPAGYDTGSAYTVIDSKETLKLKFMHSTAEAAIFINNPDTFGEDMDLLAYLSEDKENDAKATGAIVDDEGNVDNTPIKKIKGRGNTTWLKNKKPFNVTYDSAVSIDGMEKTKKLSLLANYQDAALVRNRLLQDLSDAVDMPYASDSRFVDLYMNGEYLGSYQVTQKVDIGKNNLVPEIDDDTHLNDDGTLKEEFPFICEVDASAGDGDYWIRTSSARCKLTLKGPELDEDDPYYDTVLEIAKEKFDNMYDAVRRDSEDMPQLVDIDSITKIMLINELSKNWDVGVSSLYFVYKQDTEGNWKFFASPVWDYDNSIGNATGVSRDLRNMGVTDYEEPTGWWVKFKPGADSSKKSSKYTILGYAARNKTIMAHAAQVWFDDFLPAIESFNSQGISDGEIYSSDVYYNFLEGTAAMNYTLGWRINTGDWICDHSTLRTGTFNERTGEFVEAATDTTYDITTFEGEWGYAVDWLNTRVAWLSAQFYEQYMAANTDPNAVICGDADLNRIVNVKDATTVQKHAASLLTLEDKALTQADVTGEGTVNVLDATAIQKYVAGILDRFPAESN